MAPFDADPSLEYVGVLFAAVVESPRTQAEVALFPSAPPARLVKLQQAFFEDTGPNLRPGWNWSQMF